MPQLGEGKRIVVADGDDILRNAAERLLVTQGYAVTSVRDGEAALRAAASDGTDLMVVDLMLPVIDGLSVCRQLQADGAPVPVIVVAPRGCTDDCVACLDGGADDYVAKPFAIEELLARIRALLRRTNGSAASQLTFGDDEAGADQVVLDTERHLITRRGHVIDMTLTEYSILEILLRNIDVVLARSTLYERIWGCDLHESSKALDVHVGSLRRKLEQYGPRIIHNVRGVGYVIRNDAPTIGTTEPVAS